MLTAAHVKATGWLRATAQCNTFLEGPQRAFVLTYTDTAHAWPTSSRDLVLDNGCFHCRVGDGGFPPVHGRFDQVDVNPVLELHDTALHAVSKARLQARTASM